MVLYEWLTNTPEYPLADGRGNIIGDFSITDSEKPDLDGGNAWIGVTELSSESNGDWQFEGKNFQYWVKTDASGSFDIKHVRPGTYTLFAIKNGAINEYKMENIIVSAASTTNLGNVNWTIPRNNGKLVWEIGIPDRTAAEYKLGDFDYCEGFVQNKFASTFPNPIEYNVADKNWSEVLPYVHSTYFKSDGSFESWNWNINFELTGTIPTTGNAKLTVAFASADHAQFWVDVNNSRITPSPFYPPVGGGNAFLRQSNHAKYGLTILEIPYNILQIGSNVIKLQMPSTSSPAVNHVMYDYISLEGDLTATLSTESNELAETIKVFPNPSNSIFKVLLPNTINEVTTELYSISGSLVYSQKHNNIQNSLKLDISSKPDGIYFLRIIGDEPVTIKIIKK
ncbi:polysaccharide lyase family protein [Thalassobellus suaedae]|uniref:Polysaccharide lyase family protein n=1 Tax=Thalassobellus suaedae TaxID=3074124 RepID=A0ABY9XXK4_9FLAO|nr:polysaccharide lyase family protein [Flavobacteriaceae bacterium HL-DH14]